MQVVLRLLPLVLLVEGQGMMVGEVVYSVVVFVVVGELQTLEEEELGFVVLLVEE